MTSVHDALRSGDLGAMQEVLAETSDVNERDKSRRRQM